MKSPDKIIGILSHCPVEKSVSFDSNPPWLSLRNSTINLIVNIVERKIPKRCTEDRGVLGLCCNWI